MKILSFNEASMNWKQFLPFVVIGGGVAAVATFMTNRLKLILTDSSKASVHKEDLFRAKIHPSGLNERDDGPPIGICTGIHLEVENLTEQDIEINWNKTYYTLNGHTEEGFLHGGSKALHTQMVLPRHGDVVFPQLKFERELKPTANIKEFDIPASKLPIPSGRQTVVAPLGPGTHGIYLIIKVGETEYKVHMEFDLEREKKQGYFSKFLSRDD